MQCIDDWYGRRKPLPAPRFAAYGGLKGCLQTPAPTLAVDQDVDRALCVASQCERKVPHGESPAPPVMRSPGQLGRALASAGSRWNRRRCQGFKAPRRRAAEFPPCADCQIPETSPKVDMSPAARYGRIAGAPARGSPSRAAGATAECNGRKGASLLLVRIPACSTAASQSHPTQTSAPCAHLSPGNGTTMRATRYLALALSPMVAAATLTLAPAVMAQGVAANHPSVTAEQDRALTAGSAQLALTPAPTPTKKITKKPTSTTTKKTTKKPTSTMTKKTTKRPTSTMTKKTTKRPTSTMTKKTTKRPTSTMTKKTTKKPTSTTTKKTTKTPTPH
ncbi:hypothetical protein QFZ67_005169 [Streptomyces sp. V1I1]|nr:hypothetical protein [Streptomyces sp. V1I1]